VLRLGRHLQHPPARDRLRLARPQGRQHRKTAPDVIATGNLGCITQIAGGTGIPIVHTVELLDWASGGPEPAALRKRETPAAVAELMVRRMSFETLASLAPQDEARPSQDLSLPHPEEGHLSGPSRRVLGAFQIAC
jgi:hypothetical protein